MINYNVRWEIDIQAETPEDAVLQARQYQLDAGAQVGYFTAHWVKQGVPMERSIDLDREDLECEP